LPEWRFVSERFCSRAISSSGDFVLEVSPATKRVCAGKETTVSGVAAQASSLAPSSRVLAIELLVCAEVRLCFSRRYVLRVDCGTQRAGRATLSDPAARADVTIGTRNPDDRRAKPAARAHLSRNASSYTLPLSREAWHSRLVVPRTGEFRWFPDENRAGIPAVLKRDSPLTRSKAHNVVYVHRGASSLRRVTAERRARRA
jgi:hypothetical protein